MSGFPVVREGYRPEGLPAKFKHQGEDGQGGTYSIKLFGAKILGGKIRCTSSPKEGTAFTLDHPLMYSGQRQVKWAAPL